MNMQEVQKFVAERIAPAANECDRTEQFPMDLVVELAQQGWLVALADESLGGRNLDLMNFGELFELLGRGCGSVRAMVMLQNMVASLLQRWGNEEQKQKWIPGIAGGQIIAAFALSEPDVGSDALNIKASAVRSANEIKLNGKKTWITLGQIAHLFIVFARLNGKHTAFLVPRESPGLEVFPISSMLGLRAAMLAELRFKDCRIPGENIIGGIGFGLAPVGTLALNIGRYSIAWGCLGMARVCLDIAMRHVLDRQQFGTALKNFQLVQQKIADMIVSINAARYLCEAAATVGSFESRRAMMHILQAKYFATTMVARVTSDAIQLCGALGCRNETLQRLFRDAKVMEIIEGTTQIHQIKIAEFAIHEYKRKGSF
ncbi:acyl-CoA dehydrogenase family protein [candidate division KSB1 bacterium]|nr:acyl-CoA dehydrogenase family protein [candidate division KSB1 bacterium]